MSASLSVMSHARQINTGTSDSRRCGIFYSDLDPLELLLDLEVVDVQVSCVSGEHFLPIFLSPNTGICLSMRESMGSSEDGARRGFGRLTFSAGGRGSPPGDEWHCPMSAGGAFFFCQNGMSPNT